MNPRQLAVRLLNETPDLLAEPGAAQLLLLAGAEAPPSPASRLCSPDGSCVESSGSAGEAWLPLSPLPSSHRQPYHVLTDSLREAIHTLEESLVADYDSWSRGTRCRPRLGCRPLHERPEPLDPGWSWGRAYAPRVCVPTAAGHRCIRPRRERSLETLWLTLAWPSGCIQLACTKPPCLWSLGPSSLALLQGRAALQESRAPGSCSPQKLAVDTLLDQAYSGLRPEHLNPSLWVLGPALPLAAERRGESLELLLWNPSARPVRATLLSRRYRIRRALLRTPQGRVDELMPEYDRVRVPLPPLALRVVGLELRRLPPLLRGLKPRG